MTFWLVDATLNGAVGIGKRCLASEQNRQKNAKRPARYDQLLFECKARMPDHAYQTSACGALYGWPCKISLAAKLTVCNRKGQYVNDTLDPPALTPKNLLWYGGGFLGS